MAQWVGKVNGNTYLNADRCTVTGPLCLYFILLQKLEWHRSSSRAWTIETSVEITGNLVINLIADWILMGTVIWKGNFIKVRFYQHLHKFGLLIKPECHGYLYCWCLCIFWLYLKTLNSFNSEPYVAFVYHPFWRLLHAMKAAPNWKYQMLSVATRAQTEGKGGPISSHPFKAHLCNCCLLGIAA